MLRFFSLPLSLSHSHKSNLLNSCLHCEIILGLFFTVAAQRWICKRYFFCKVCLLSNNLAVSRHSRVWRETLGRRGGSMRRGPEYFKEVGWRTLCLHRLLLLELQTTGGFPICLSTNTFTFPPRKGCCRMKLALTGFEYHFTKVNSHFCC